VEQKADNGLFATLAVDDFLEVINAPRVGRPNQWLAHKDYGRQAIDL